MSIKEGKRTQRRTCCFISTFFCGQIQTAVGGGPTLTRRPETTSAEPALQAQHGAEPTAGGQEQPSPSSGTRLVSGHRPGWLSSAGKLGEKKGCFRRWFRLPWVPLLAAGEIWRTSAGNEQERSKRALAGRHTHTHTLSHHTSGCTAQRWRRVLSLSWGGTWVHNSGTWPGMREENICFTAAHT